jgi:PleD family two-component response regulator
VARETEELFHERITFSAGITSYGLCGFNNKDTFIRADELLYKAKIDKNMVVMIDDTTK